MRLRGLVIFVLLNIAISAGVAFLIISTFGNQPQEDQIPRFATVEVIVTATLNPNATPVVQIITATPQPGSIPAIPTEVLEDVATVENTQVAAANTLDPVAVEANTELQGTATALPPGCILHTLEEGENPSIVAGIYGLNDVNSLLLVNNLTEEDVFFLQVGQVLIVPLEDCPLESLIISTGDATDETSDVTTEDGTPDANATVDPAGTPDPDASAETTTPQITPTPSPSPTITLAPTAASAQIEIQDISAVGDVTAESVVIYNSGATVDITNWTLEDLDGNVYTFNEQRLFNDSLIEVFTRVGDSTVPIKFWNRTESVWQPGDVATLRDADGDIQAQFRIPTPVDLGS